MVQILIVDDEPHIRDLIAEILRDEGFDVHTAVNGQQMLDSIEISQPALVLLDVMMPGISGPEALVQLRSRSHLEDIPVVMMSAGLQVILGDLPLNGFLSKPFDLGELLNVVAHALETA